MTSDERTIVSQARQIRALEDELETAEAAYQHWKLKAEQLAATLESWVKAPPAEMSYHGRLVPINSTGMREVVDEATRLRSVLRDVLFDLDNIGPPPCDDLEGCDCSFARAFREI